MVILIPKNISVIFVGLKEDISEFRRVQASTMKKKTKLFENYGNSLKQCQSRLQKYSPKTHDKDVPSSIDNDDDDNSLFYADFASDRFRDNSKRSKPDRLSYLS